MSSSQLTDSLHDVAYSLGFALFLNTHEVYNCSTSDCDQGFTLKMIHVAYHVVISHDNVCIALE